ncbi:YdgH/BhsA/McbA-like domain containing protein [Sodalis ligni]|uniref:Multiple stress resistance protein BhsA/MqsR-controlled colanic acid and biofilm protein A n=1 Tax=Sodalis ligni TaxID=2697027 RepID=A0A4R1N9A9_9GAMM|nr:YdgH/BhsA/McbA-like domain containing protein [Sodalis ligni]TCL02101.1 multiple stress resistance protein BhsA/MqsR-controlled colanic acid and biofilm protein A [Sodalis ligni]
MQITRKIALPMLIISALSFSSLAATEVQSAETHIVIGHVSVSGKTTRDEVIAGLEKKAEEAGASFFKVTAVGGKNKMYGNAVLFK